MKSLKRAALAASATAILTAGIAVGAPAPASAATGVVYNVNIAGWCKSPSRGLSGFASNGARYTNRWSAYSWECTTTSWGRTVRQSGVDMNAACRFTTGRSNASARLGSASDAFGWFCVYTY